MIPARTDGHPHCPLLVLSTGVVQGLVCGLRGEQQLAEIHRIGFATVMFVTGRIFILSASLSGRISDCSRFSARAQSQPNELT